MSFFGGSSSPPAPPAPPPVPKPIPKKVVSTDDTVAPKASAEVLAVQQKEEDRSRKRKGRKSTILTSGQGVIGEAETRKKSLLGE